MWPVTAAKGVPHTFSAFLQGIASLVGWPGVRSELSRTWHLVRSPLKHNSAIFWWRTREDDPQGITSSLIPFSELRVNGPP